MIHEFIQLLQEASNAGIADVKKLLKKDSNTKILFLGAAPSADQVKDPRAFKDALKFFFFNNTNVQKFIKSRAIHYDFPDKPKHPNARVGDVGEAEFFNIRNELKDVELTDKALDNLRDYFKDFFKEYDRVEKRALSKDARNELLDWTNTQSGAVRLSQRVQHELASIPGIRPDKKVRLYRGILFPKWAFNSSKDWDQATGEYKSIDGNGVKFLKSIRTGERTVDLDWDKPSSWTTSYDIAQRFAQYGSASSEFAATMKWFDRSINKRAIDGDLGFVISTLADPQDILADMGKVNVGGHRQHGGEGEMILRPGKRLARIVNKYTVKGEVDPVSKTGMDPKLKKVVDVMDEASDMLAELDLKRHDWPHAWAKDVLRGPEDYLNFNDPELTKELNAKFTAIMKLVKEELPDLDSLTITNDMVDASSDEDRETVRAAKEFQEVFLQKVVNKAFKDEHKSRGPLFKVDLGDARTALGSPYDLKVIEDSLMRSSPITDRDLARAITRLANKTDDNFYRRSWANQQPVIDSALKVFARQFDQEPSPGDDTYRAAVNILRRVYRNHTLNQILGDIKRGYKKRNDEE